MNITTKQTSVLIYTMHRTNFPISESRLNIFNIKLNASIKFQCSASNEKNSKKIYFRVRGKLTHKIKFHYLA